MKPEKRRDNLRCAIYTRVSTENGLEQEFNSLDNQREASEAYIRSQAHEGWRLLRERYDDGGFSGGSIDRPALKKLLDDVGARRIDVIVVYKVDRLTRSLADFAKLVELFDAHGVSFISVTQSFNTTTSMGRLTLNMLLSFAQFEREITGERIRDKVAASKKRGIWMGGAVPLAYRVENRALHVVEDQADFVRDLFRRYLELGSVVRLKAALDLENVRLPVRTVGTGATIGGGLISRGHLYHILSNPIYTGRLRHKGQIHEGLHEGIVDRDLWDRVQRRLADQTRTTKPSLGNAAAHSFLTGKIYDDRGNRMTPSHAAKGARRWRYYVSQAALKGRRQDAGSVMRVPAAEIERRVLEVLTPILRSQELRVPDRAIAGVEVPALDQPDPGQRAINHPRATAGPRPPSDAWRNGIERVIVGANELEIRLNDTVAIEGQHRLVTIPWTRPSSRIRRQIIEVEGECSSTARPMRVRESHGFLEAVRRAHHWLDELTRDTTATIESLAAREGRSERSIRLTLSLAFVAPPILAAAIDGRLPRGFGVKRLMDLPMAWSAQWTALGLKAPARV